MQIQTLNGSWQVRQFNTEDWLPACVPGGVHTDLLAAGRIPDPFVGENEKAVQWVAEKDWVYRRFFYPNLTAADGEPVFLVCDGLDTLADVRLNGKILDTTDNAFRSYEWEVQHLLRAGENTLEIQFHAPAAYIRGRERVKPMSAMDMGMRGGPHLRKPPSHFGWDWGPVLPCIGIWKDIRLEHRAGTRITGVRLEQLHEHMFDPSEAVVTITAHVQAELPEGEENPLTLQIRATAPDGTIKRAKMPAQKQAALPLKIYKPLLWWSRGLGEQNLYQIDVELVEGDPGSEDPHVVDTHTYTIGLRTVELRQEEEKDGGKAFMFVVNGVPVFAKGSNWIPADSFPARITPEQEEHLIRSAAEANHNMLRIWGGGYYESDNFYNLCDRYGILVWQDFQFACATYPLDDPTYVETTRQEVIQNVRRLRHHASLALWSGNNEIEWMMTTMGWKKKQPALAQAYEQFFFHTLPEILAVEDPGRPYWPSSPSSNQPFEQPNSDQTGDAHLWEVYHAFRQPVYYRKQNPRFVSEFGFQSLPARETLEAFAPPNGLRSAGDVQSSVMLCHQKAPAGNAKLIWYIAQRFRLPKTLDGLIYLSQIFQAEAMRIAVEHWRRHPKRTSGALYWQLNDCWPVVSWASIDYYGRWKALHYAARRFYAPVLLSVEEEVDSRKRGVNVWLTSDLPEAWRGRLRWTLETLDGEVLEGGDQPVEAAPNSAQCILTKPFTAAADPAARKANWRRTVFVVELLTPPDMDGVEHRIALIVTPFAPEKHMPLPDPALESRVTIQDDRLLVTVTARKLARFVEVKLTGVDAVFSDNYFDLPAGRSATVACPLPGGWDAEQARAKLSVCSLTDAGPFYTSLSAAVQSSKALAACVAAVAKLIIRR